jgi:hypothetical protein
MNATALLSREVLLCPTPQRGQVKKCHSLALAVWFLARGSYPIGCVFTFGP